MSNLKSPRALGITPAVIAKAQGCVKLLEPHTAKSERAPGPGCTLHVAKTRSPVRCGDYWSWLHVASAAESPLSHKA